MQYIKKQVNEPPEWYHWFTVPPNRRSYDYTQDSGALPNLRSAREYLINEQNGLCAYCQQKIEVEGSSIEHVISKAYNKELSTSYHNLVAVCNKNQVKDLVTDKFHCDRNRGSRLIAPIIFYSNAMSNSDRVNAFFVAYADGQIVANPNLDSELKPQVEGFVNILNLNHQILINRRSKDALNGIISGFRAIPKCQRQNFLEVQYNRILHNPKHPFREYLLIYIGRKLGMN
jgi:uncharacterized protein (TIGR02646 family)